MGKADNMLAILWMLRSGKRMTAGQLAEELGIHVRSVYRYIDSLCASGVPIVADSGPSGGYSILSRFKDSPLLFDHEEQRSLIHASVFAREAGYPHSVALERAIGKLKQYANEKQLDLLERHEQGLSVISPPLEDKYQRFLRMLEDAAGQGQTLRMAYDKGKGDQVPARLFDPYGIVYWKGNWYAVGYCGYREDIRSFRVDRMTGLHATDLGFHRPAAFSARDFLLSHLLPSEGDSRSMETVLIRGQEQVLNELCRHWLFGHALAERQPEAAVFRLDSALLSTYVPYFLMPYSTSLTIESVPLARRMAEACRTMAEHYGAMLTNLELRGEGEEDG
ncbi:YafY family protein [Paenibacillus sp. PAMC21692]|uniref:helix-turn-helix transcriptional regulator n=1 Tax=Paenibacillus sp. PAMC21692 TaxID=2762320 RepID=UPI00164ED100|nr:WYL domain-containing protein [Paenibacillus sp. PAMC21692]QNK56855.1 WYL domain-containing protein [Paenibacillus sp. PAMC21692]